MNKIAKVGVVVSSLLLAGTLIAYEGGYIPVSMPGQGKVVVPAEAQTPGAGIASAPVNGEAVKESAPLMLPSSKSYTGATPGSTGVPGQIPTPAFMSSSKDAIMTVPATPAPNPADAVKPTVILPSSKSIGFTPAEGAKSPAVGAPTTPATGPAPEVIMLFGSKSGGFTPVTPGTSKVPATSTRPATSTAPATAPATGGSKTSEKGGK